MNKTLLVACAVAGGLFVALAVPPPAQALPSVNLGIEKKADAVMHLAKRGGRGFRGGRAFRGRGFRGGRAFRGRGFRRGRAFRGRGFRRGRAFRGRGFRRGRALRGRAIRRGRVYGYRGYGKRRFRRRRFRRSRRFYGYVPYAAYGYYGGRCAWLRRRAYRTGSAYWWSRYNRCRYYY